MEMIIGTVHETTVTVTGDITAASMKSGELDVLATPYMIALMECAASELCEKYTPDGISTVGTNVNVSHLAATPIGMKVTAKAVLTSFDGRKATFDVEAYDEVGLIGKGTHERFTVKAESFMKKAMERKA